MKRFMIYLISILLGIILSIYIFIIWEPLEDNNLNNKIRINDEINI